MKEKNLFYAARNLALVFLGLMYFKHSLPLIESWRGLDMVLLLFFQSFLYIIAIGLYLWHENAIDSGEVLAAKLLFLVSFTISVCLSNTTWYWLLIPGGCEAFGVLEERKVINFFKK